MKRSCAEPFTRWCRAGMLSGGLAVVPLALVWTCRGDDGVRVASFNIEMFPRATTDHDAVASTIAELDADVIAVQEIRGVEALDAVLADASRRGGRRLAAVLSDCADPRRFTTGVVYDAARLRLVATRTFPRHDPSGRASCSEGIAATLAVLADADGRQLAVLSVHLAAFPEGFAERRRQWADVLRILAEVRGEFGVEGIALGDFNSTGYSTAPPDEPAFIRDVVARAGMTLLTDDLPCTEYWQPVAPFSEVLPSLLDHAVATGDDWGTPTVAGMCARLLCKPRAAVEMDRHWRTVSDHCPIVVDGQLD